LIPCLYRLREGDVTLKISNHNKGPGIAAGVVLMALIDMLVEKKVLTREDATNVIKRASLELGNRPHNVAAQDAAAVLTKMIIRLSDDNV
jgi:hypothetical protein